MSETPIEPPKPESIAVPRLRWIWIGVAILYLAYFGLGVAQLKWPSPELQTGIATERAELQYAIKSREALSKLDSIANQSGGGSSSLGGANNPDQQFISIEDRLRPKAQNSDEAAALLLTSQAIRGAEPEESALDRLLLSEDPKSIALGQAFAGEPVDATAISGDGLVEKVARYKAQHPENGPISASDAGITTNLGLIALAGVILIGALLGGLVLLTVYLVMKLSGRLPNAGYQEDLVPGDADRHGGRFFVYLGSFILLSLFVPLFGEAAGVAPIWLNVAVMLIMLVLAPMFGTLPIRGRGFSSRELFGQTSHKFRLVLWGIAAFMANFPIVMLTVLVVSPFRNVLPEPSHEAIEQMMNTPGLGSTIALFFVAAIAAPFIEEIMFRGILTPGLNKVLRSPTFGIVLGGVMFGFMHPQGPLLWPGLAMIGISSAILTRQTGSLIPSIVMHACHNATILLLNVTLNT